MMRPAFSSAGQAGAFALLLVVVLLLPALAGKKLLPPRAEVYTQPSLGVGCFPFIRRQIFEETNDVDIAFIGSSHIWTAMDTPYVQAALDNKLGRKTSVVTLGWNWSGFDALYFITKDLLEHRPVHLLVINDEYSPDWPIPHMASLYWFRYGDNWDDLQGLSLASRSAYYADSLRGLPRNLLSLVRTNLPVKWPVPQNNWDRSCNDANTDKRLGALTILLGFGTEKVGNPDYVAYTPGQDVPPADVCIYSSETKARFEMTGPVTPPEHLFFARKLAALAKDKGVKLVWLHIPKFEENRALAIPERECWPQVLPGVTMLGIPPVKLTAGMSDQDIRKLFYNNAHMNKNGQEYFTRAITPALLNLYAP